MDQPVNEACPNRPSMDVPALISVCGQAGDGARRRARMVPSGPLRSAKILTASPGQGRAPCLENTARNPATRSSPRSSANLRSRAAINLQISTGTNHVRIGCEPMFPVWLRPSACLPWHGRNSGTHAVEPASDRPALTGRSPFGTQAWRQAGDLQRKSHDWARKSAPSRPRGLPALTLSPGRERTMSESLRSSCSGFDPAFRTSAVSPVGPGLCGRPSRRRC